MNYGADTLDFPAVSICNLNQYTKNSLDNEPEFKRFLYDLHKQIVFGYPLNYSDYNLTQFNYTDFLYKSHPPLFERNKPNSSSLVGTGNECNWANGVPCDADNFTVVATERGICYTFNEVFSPSRQNADILKVCSR